MEKEVHEFEPVYDENSKVLILGSFPSVLSRKNEFYYGNPRNRFWKVLAALTNEEEPETVPEKKEFLLRNGIAVYDAAESCKIEGSSDSSMKDIEPSSLSPIFEKADIKKVFANGRKAYDIIVKYHVGEGKDMGTEMELELLPSTSPANAQYSLERLIECWQPVSEALNIK